jgi:hypothetical protein
MPPGAGAFALLGLILFVPFEIWRERSQKWASLSPIEQNLQRASHGIALGVLVPFGTLAIFGKRSIADAAAAVPVDPVGHGLPAAGLAALLLYGVARFVVGWRRSAGVREGLLATRAFIKLAIGTTVTVWVLSNLQFDWHNAAGQQVAFAFLVVPLWLAITGAVRFLLLVRPAGRALSLVEENIAVSEWSWDGGRARRWWQFWKR